MLKQLKSSKAQSVFEYMILIIVVVSVLTFFNKYIQRGVSGRMKQVGDSYSSGRLYDPETTVECAYDFRWTTKWYDWQCFEDTCGQATCLNSDHPQRLSVCRACIDSCENPECTRE